MNHIEAINELMSKWHETRFWAEELLCTKFNLNNAFEILEPEFRGKIKIPDTPWFYRTHGVGVDISKPNNTGGIDFDFNKEFPDSWDLREFMIKQLNDGAIPKRIYRPLLQNKEAWENAVNSYFNTKNA